MSVPTVKRLEAADGELGGRAETGDKIVAALEAAGVEFIPENGGGPGVRLKKAGAKPDDHPKPLGPATDAVDAMDRDIKADRSKRKKT